MKIIYITSWYPTLNDTFVTREMTEVVNAGHTIEVCVLRPGKRRINARPLEVSGISINGVGLFGVGRLALGYLQCMFARPARWFRCTCEALLSAFRQPSRAPDLLLILIATAYFATRRSLRDARYIHAHFLHAGAIAARWMSRILGIPYGVTIHIPMIRFENALMAAVVTDAAVCATTSLRTVEFATQLGAPHAVLIRSGVDVSEMKYSPPGPLPDGCPLILGIGALIPEKGFDVLIQACNILRSESYPFKCRILGDGTEREALEARGRELLKNGILEMPGVLPAEEVMRQFRRASVLVMPCVPCSEGTDGLPTVIIEAMAHGVPVISTRHAGIPDLVRNGETGMLLEPGDPHSLSEAIKAMLSSPEECARLAEAARREIEHEYDLRRNVRLQLTLVSEATGLGRDDQLLPEAHRPGSR
jgi:colanic acid/amylovoran biosynthesis glycosyltransferase